MRSLTLVLSLIVLLVGCTDTESNGSMSSIVGQGEPEQQIQYEPVVKGKHFIFPEDHLAHPGFRQEWWYLTANLQTEDGRKLGIQWTQFRMALGTKEVAKQTPNHWRANQVYLAHSAVTDSERHLASEKWSRQHKELAGVSGNPFTVWIDDWRWQSEGEKLLPAILSVDSTEFSYELALTGDKPLQFQGENGFSIKSADGSVASYYYSQPFIKVNGSVQVQDEQLEVTGNAWLDREWSSQFLTDDQQGWDWFSLRLSDGSTLMLFQLRSANEDMEHFYSAKRMFPDGSGYSIDSSDVSMQVIKQQSIEGRDYPVGWQIEIPQEKISLRTRPLNPKAKMPLSIPYWEGPILISGSHSGEGYMELTGY
ncbi:lipocalin-like domain-containing protein [Vibrio sp. HN007]|uniref:lipocalin-like domain-containing protein n=1 Tax=Vibrio iocasae TaxID=3098914 RepID=UPI0035D4F0CE